MPSVWSKLSDFWTWFLWGKRTYSDLDAEKKKEARHDLYCRLFVISNSVYFVTLYATFLLSMKTATLTEIGLNKIVPEGGNGVISIDQYLI
ncbi:PGG domain-containing protein [Caenorhabditis elegans]|uniref:PGG domain-containing protein n=1 Tax=Caenorhabditis elegans TaxID=6239 RepID=Q5WRN7_CAEEL|nr:PGG domain-containing protein [Caenorhabditis elegans]CAH60788.2 PGG domain-containing protein [Caenorhabditis elegans]|eukprot:NP_001023811.2 Uncharacterized protein CELE_F17C11.13 [Caenorhabditis elegans]